MDYSSFDAWLKRYGKAWMLQKPELIPELFATNAKYHEKPFGETFEGLDKIIQYWKGVCDTQKEISFEYNIISVTGVGVAHFAASFLRDTERVKLDGIIVASFDSENKCIDFAEWWQSQKS